MCVTKRGSHVSVLVRTTGEAQVPHSKLKMQPFAAGINTYNISAEHSMDSASVHQRDNQDKKCRISSNQIAKFMASSFSEGISAEQHSVINGTNPCVVASYWNE
jgi:hypothetical protein